MTIRCQVAFPETLSGVGADLFVNTWHIIDGTAGTNPVLAAQDFLNALEGTFYPAVDTYMSDLVGQVGSFKAYDLNDAIPRTPILEASLTVNPAGGTTLPPELAVVLSFRADYASGQPKARRRGRVFLGAVNNAALDATTGQIATGAAAAIRDAAQDLLDISDASSTFVWAVYSPTDATARGVLGGWVDNSFDIQRRRGLDLTSRSQFGAGH